MTEDFLTIPAIQRIWHAHHLGPVESIAKPKRGWANKVLLVNDSHVIRFDVVDSEGISRWTIILRIFCSRTARLPESWILNGPLRAT
ncbi:MAG: hypothetical protein HND46_21130 [Chloroflexi bacterium]|nr:hypothetical protein [Chloroflexota bacterium]